MSHNKEVQELIENLQILEELQRLSTGGRVMRYGAISTFFLMLSRALHGNVNNHVVSFLEKIDNIITDFQSSGYHIRVNKTDLGEVYNRSRTYVRDNWDNASAEDKEEWYKHAELMYSHKGFYQSIIKNINIFLSEILKVSVDYIQDNNIASLNSISSINSFINLKTNDSKIKSVQNILNEYSDFIENMPNRFFAGILSKKNVYVTTDLIDDALNSLSKSMTDHIVSKYSINPGSVHTLINRQS